jgi:arginine-tRNA-protein transferase
MLGSVYDCGACPYLPDRHFHVFMPHDDVHQSYRQLMDAGFRRNGASIYHTHCPDCQACQATRVSVPRFTLRKDQKRCLKKNLDLTIQEAPLSTDKEHQALFLAYETSVHKNHEAELEHLTEAGEQQCMELQARDENGTLVAVSLIDVFEDAVSSVYCYYDPRLHRRALGNYMVLQEIEFCKKHGLEWLYLGFYVAECQKLAYKARFRPIQVLENMNWREITS